jgi:hypothetical protein
MAWNRVQEEKNKAFSEVLALGRIDGMEQGQEKRNR